LVVVQGVIAAHNFKTEEGLNEKLIIVYWLQVYEERIIPFLLAKSRSIVLALNERSRQENKITR
jgi:hypothetical protein